MANDFGDYLRNRRLSMNKTLRSFCMEHKEDPSNWSKLERGVLQPPGEYARLHQIAGHLDLMEIEFKDLIDLANAQRGQIPSDLMANEGVVKQLPIIFRTLRGDPPTEDELMKLADKIGERHRGDS